MPEVVSSGIGGPRSPCENAYDLVLMDCKCADGCYKATAEIRNRSGLPNIRPSSAMTAHALEGDRENAWPQGWMIVSEAGASEDLASMLKHWLPAAPR